MAASSRFTVLKGCPVKVADEWILCDRSFGKASNFLNIYSTTIFRVTFNARSKFPSGPSCACVGFPTQSRVLLWSILIEKCFINVCPIQITLAHKSVYSRGGSKQLLSKCLLCTAWAQGPTHEHHRWVIKINFIFDMAYLVKLTYGRLFSVFTGTLYWD